MTQSATASTISESSNPELINAATERPASTNQQLPGYSDNCPAAKVEILDGFRNSRALTRVLNRVSLASLVYAAASSMFVYALLQGFNVNMFGWGPLMGALANVTFVVYFTMIMVPFALMVAWLYRYRMVPPYQKQVMDIKLGSDDAFDLSLAALLALPGSRLLTADKNSGELLAEGKGVFKAGAQEIKVSVEKVSSEESRLIVTSQPKLNAIEYSLFGYTLAVDNGRNKKNVDDIAGFLNSTSIQHSAC